jgi:hypothetical protein
MFGKSTKAERLQNLRARTVGEPPGEAPGDADPLAERRARRKRRERARLEAIRVNDPAHDDTPPRELERVRAWVRENLAPAKNAWDSYGLKHAAERDLGRELGLSGYHVSNAAIKGVMLEAGYEPAWDNGINMGFCVARRGRDE